MWPFFRLRPPPPIILRTQPGQIGSHKSWTCIYIYIKEVVESCQKTLSKLQFMVRKRNDSSYYSTQGREFANANHVGEVRENGILLTQYKHWNTKNGV